MNSQKIKEGGKLTTLGIQHVFAMFGSTVLVPLLTGLPVSVSLFCAGIGTIIFFIVTKGKVPVFLGSSFAFIAAIVLAAASSANLSGNFTEEYAAQGYNAITMMFSDYGRALISNPDYLAALPYATGGIVIAGLVYLILSAIVMIFGADRVRSFFPPIVTGPMVVIIGLMLAPTAIGYFSTPIDWLIGAVVIATVIVVSLLGKGFVKMIPLIFGIAAGYILCMILTASGIDVGLSYSSITSASLITVPGFFLPKFSLSAILIVAPIAIVTFVEHIGDITANGAVVGKDFFKDPGLHRTLLGDGLASIVAGFLGGPANTTYSENTGVLAATRNYNPVTLLIAAIFAIIISFVGYVSGFINSIPSAVIGGMCIILFGMIASVGLRNLVENKVDFKNQRNVFIAAIMLVVAIGGMTIPINADAGMFLQGYALAAVIGIVLNKILPERLGKVPEDKKEEKSE
ncbi:MAG: uracil-xanthine permease family protein [Methanocorpusculum sp.]|nr:uracil-xanthine permease family protein [Methanocorpusculum sp.]